MCVVSLSLSLSLLLLSLPPLPAWHVLTSAAPVLFVAALHHVGDFVVSGGVDGYVRLCKEVRPLLMSVCPRPTLLTVHTLV